MIARRLTRITGTILTVLTFALATGPAGHADPGPELHLSSPVARLGEYVVVSGSGFSRGAQLQIEICGTGGSSNSCQLQDATHATADGAGAFTTHLRVSEPPTPCPCTVHAAPFAGAAESPVDTPIQIPGLRYLPDAAPAGVGQARLLDATVADDSSPFVQIGGQGSAAVTLTFADLSGGPAPDPGITLVLTRGSRTIGTYPVRWTGGDLALGQRRSLVYDVPLPGGWFRDYGIAVLLGKAAGGRQVTARTLAASVRPWGELLAPAALLLGVLLLVVTRRRHHHEAVPRLPVRPGAAPGRRTGGAEPEDGEQEGGEQEGGVGAMTAPDIGGRMSEDESPTTATPSAPEEP